MPDYIIKVNGIEGQWCNGLFAPLIKNKTAKELIKMGYRVVSRNFCLISRIDRADWLRVLKNDHSNAENNEGWENFYRRGKSKDVITVSVSVMRQIPNSGNEKTGFMKKEASNGKQTVAGD